MDLYVFSKDLKFKGIIDNFTSLRWIRRYYKSGEFELHCALTPTTLNLLSKENIIYKKGDVEAGYIEYRQLKEDDKGNELMVIKGKFLTSYLNRRIIWDTENIKDTVSNAMGMLVDNCCINPVDVKRIIPGMMLGDIIQCEQELSYQVSYKILSDELEKLSQLSELGHRVLFDIENKKLIFNVYSGVDRSRNQNINPIVTFSKKFDNVTEQEYVDSLNNYKNVAFVCGQEFEGERRNTTVGSSSGLDRFELFVDARDIDDTKTVNEVEVPIPTNEYIPLLITRGNSKLAETKEIKKFNNKVDVNTGFKYKLDFDLGDIVTIVNNKWGITLDSRITEIEEVYEEKGFSVFAVFGNDNPTLIDKIKHQIN